MGYPSAYRALLERHIAAYLGKHAAMLPAALVLAAEYAGPDDPRGAGGGGGPLDGAAVSSLPRLPVVASAEVSFCASTRSKPPFSGLHPPDGPGNAYLCNMAVASSWRARGVGAALLAAAHAAAAAAGATDVYLHLRLKGAAGPAGALYASAGYGEAGRDPALVRVLGRERRLLLRRGLAREE